LGKKTESYNETLNLGDRKIFLTLFPLLKQIIGLRFFIISLFFIFSLCIISSELSERYNSKTEIYRRAAIEDGSGIPIIHSSLPMHDCGADHSHSGATVSSESIPPQFIPACPEVLLPAVIDLLPLCPMADGFDMPVGAPDGAGYYIAQIYGKNRHMGEDWNARGGSHLDFGKPVYSAANGVVHWAIENKGSWGNFIRVIHNIGTESRPKYIETFYAHMEEMYVKSGDVVSRGEQIGTIGDADGKYNPHLHFEMKLTVGSEVGKGYGEDPKKAKHVPPYPFIVSRRPHKYMPAR